MLARRRNQLFGFANQSMPYVDAFDMHVDAHLELMNNIYTEHWLGKGQQLNFLDGYAYRGRSGWSRQHETTKCTSKHLAEAVLARR